MAEQLEAIIEETIFRNEENGYSVVQAKAGRESVTVVGALPALAPGEQVSLSGGWVEHPQYGKQWKATACEMIENGEDNECGRAGMRCGRWTSPNM